MNIVKSVKDAYKSLTGEREKEELLLLLSEWDALLKACTTRIEGLEKGYDFLRRSMFLKRELDGWKRLAVVSILLSLVSLGCVAYLLLFRGR